MQKCFKKCIRISSKKGKKVSKNKNDKISKGAKKIAIFFFKREKSGQKGVKKCKCKKVLKDSKSGRKKTQKYAKHIR